MLLKLGNIFVFTIYWYWLLKGAAHRRRAPRKNKRQIITLSLPLRASHSHPSLARPPILLLEMDGGAPGDGWRRLRPKRWCETSVSVCMALVDATTRRSINAEL